MSYNNKEYYEQENGSDKIVIDNNGFKYKILVVEKLHEEWGIPIKSSSKICISTKEEIYAIEIKQIEILKEKFIKQYPYVVFLHIDDYNSLTIKNKIKHEDIINNDNSDDPIIPESNNIIEDASSESFISEDIINEKLNGNSSDSESIDDEDNSSLSSNENKEDISISKLKVENKIPDGNIDDSILNNNNLENNERIIHEQDTKDGISNTNIKIRINKESKNILNKVIKDYYRFHNRLLPVINNIVGINFKNINNNILKEHKINVENILQYYEIYKAFILSCKDVNSKNFYDFIEYNKNNYCSNYYSKKQFYDKCKRCYDFILFFDAQGIIKDHIIEILYKSNISYTKLFKIRGNDYDKLKDFFIEKLILIQKTNNPSLINEITIKHNNNKDSLLIYYGSKHNYKDIINKHIKIKKESKIFDLFSGSCSISYDLNKKYPQNNIIANDNNKLLNNFYNILKNNEIELVNKIEEFNTLDFKNNYNIYLNKINEGIKCKIEEAAVYYILNKISYNGNMYFDKNNKLYISCKKDKSILNLDKNKFTNFSRFLNNIEICSTDILNSTDYWLERINKDDVVILDPPYDCFNSGYHNYGSIFDKKSHERLYIFIDKLINKGANVITFNGNTPFIKDLYKGFNIEIINSYCQPSHSTKTELFIYK